jgi:hypothetical protein
MGVMGQSLRFFPILPEGGEKGKKGVLEGVKMDSVRERGKLGRISYIREKYFFLLYISYSYPTPAQKRFFPKTPGRISEESGRISPAGTFARGKNLRFGKNLGKNLFSVHPIHV